MSDRLFTGIKGCFAYAGRDVSYPAPGIRAGMLQWGPEGSDVEVGKMARCFVSCRIWKS